jgi:hypothetical protein
MSLADLSFAPTSRFYRHIFIFLSSLTIKNTVLVCMPTLAGNLSALAEIARTTVTTILLLS